MTGRVDEAAHEAPLMAAPRLLFSGAAELSAFDNAVRCGCTATLSASATTLIF
jgi:hypothetical protein